MILLERKGVRALLPRLALRTLQTLRRTVWRITAPHTTGARAICVVGEAGLVLVRHSYMRGWFLPGGGPRRKEDIALSLLRELREEIGLDSYIEFEKLFSVQQKSNFKRDHQEIYLVKTEGINPRLSLEIEAIGIFSCDDLPDDLHDSTRYKINRWISQSKNPSDSWEGMVVPPED